MRLDSWFCDLWLVGFWYGGWVFVGCDMGLNFVVVGFVGLAMLDGVAVGVLGWYYEFMDTVVDLAVFDGVAVGLR